MASPLDSDKALDLSLKQIRERYEEAKRRKSGVTFGLMIHTNDGNEFKFRNPYEPETTALAPS